MIGERHYGADAWIEAELSYHEAVRAYRDQHVVLYDMRAARIAHEHLPGRVAPAEAEPVSILTGM